MLMLKFVKEPPENWGIYLFEEWVDVRTNSKTSSDSFFMTDRKEGSYE